ncbi:MAG: DUF1269 domain-containing protein [Anaerolineae bacterium]|nr:DUF1269 domain-containing protein [Anaerolineae bacterium]
MSDQKYSFVVVAYEGKDTCIEALETLHELSKKHEIKVKDAVALYKTESGKIKLHPKNDVTAKKGGLTGATAGLIFGLIMGVPLLGIAVGATTGALAGNISGVEKEVKHALEQELGANHSAICVLVKYAHWNAVREEMARHHGRVLISDLTEEAAAELELLAADHAVATAVEQELGDLELDDLETEDVQEEEG